MWVVFGIILSTVASVSTSSGVFCPKPPESGPLACSNQDAFVLFNIPEDTEFMAAETASCSTVFLDCEWPIGLTLKSAGDVYHRFMYNEVERSYWSEITEQSAEDNNLTVLRDPHHLIVIFWKCKWDTETNTTIEDGMLLISPKLWDSERQLSIDKVAATLEKLKTSNFTSIFKPSPELNYCKPETAPKKKYMSELVVTLVCAVVVVASLMIVIQVKFNGRRKVHPLPQ